MDKNGFALQTGARKTLMTIVRNPLRGVAALFVPAGALFGVWELRVPAVTAKLEISPNTLGVLLFLMLLGATIAFAIAGMASDIFGPQRVAR